MALAFRGTAHRILRLSCRVSADSIYAVWGLGAKEGIPRSAEFPFAEWDGDQLMDRVEAVVYSLALVYGQWDSRGKGQSGVLLPLPN